MKTSLKAAAVDEPLSIEEAKEHLRIEQDITDFDERMVGLITAAREWAENYTRRALIHQHWYMYMQGFPATGSQIELPKPPLVSVTAVRYLDENNAWQILSTDVYEADVDTQIGRVYEKHGQVWPNTLFHPNIHTVRIEFKAGYSAKKTGVPENVRSAMKLYVEELFDAPVGPDLDALRRTRDSLIVPYRMQFV